MSLQWHRTLTPSHVCLAQDGTQLNWSLWIRLLRFSFVLDFLNEFWGSAEEPIHVPYYQYYFPWICPCTTHSDFLIIFCHMHIISLTSHACYLHGVSFPILVLTACIFFFCLSRNSCDRKYLGLALIISAFLLGVVNVFIFNVIFI